MTTARTSLTLALAICLVASVAALGQSVKDDQNLFMPGSQQGDVSLESSNRCDNCHGGYNQAVEPAHNWRGSMMANAARDPLWIATMAVALQDSQHVFGNFNAGDLCIRCHSPAGWLGGRSEPTNTTALTGTDFEGVSCDFCHNMVDPITARRQSDVPPESTSLGMSEAAATYEMDVSMLSPLSLFDGSPFFDVALERPVNFGSGALPDYIESGSGQFFVDAGSSKRGPRYDAKPKHQWAYSRYHSSKYFCATCHDVSNPVVGRIQGGDPERQAAGAYGHVERTFSEFMLSAYGNGGAMTSGKIGVGVASKCQDCHMRNVTGPSCNKRGIEVRNDLALHDITGGNTWMSGILASADQAGPTWDPYNYSILSGSKYPGASVDVSGIQGFGQAIVDGQARALQQLQMAADITVVDEDSSTGALTLRITNNSGHKLLSGYPEGRRLFLNVVFYGDAGVIGEINEYEPLVTATNGSGDDVYVSGGVLGSRVEELIWEAHMSSTVTGEDKTQHFVLATGREKDNRIPPLGFRIESAASRQVVPVWEGQEDPSYFTAEEYAGGYDEVTLTKPAGTTAWSATLYYQTTSKEYVEFLRDEINGTGAITLPAGAYIAQSDPFFANLRDWGDAMWDLWLHNGGSEPVVVASVGVQAPCDKPIPPANLTATGTKRSITLGWMPVTAVDSYNVWLSQGGKYALIGQTAETSFKHSGVKPGTSQCYVVTAVRNCGESSSAESDYSNESCAVSQRK